MADSAPGQTMNVTWAESPLYEPCVQERLHQKLSVEGAYKNLSQPYKLKHLIIMALLNGLGKAMTGKDVMDWIFNNFEFCQELAKLSLWDKTAKDVSIFRGNLKFALRSAEMAFGGCEKGVEPKYTLGNGAGERMLVNDGILDGPSQNGVFPFFELPAEIYEYTFGYDQPLCFNTSIHNRAYLPSRHVDWQLGVQYAMRHVLRTKRIESILAPLLINRQFHREAMPYFFSINHFTFDQGYDAVALINRLSNKRRRLLTHVTITVDWGHGSHGARPLSVLPRLHGLKKLGLRIDERDWIQRYNSPVTSMTGMNTNLLKLTGLQEVEFHGCPSVEAKYKAGILAPKPDVAAKKGSKKRKAVDRGGNDEGKAPVKKARKARKAN